MTKKFNQQDINLATAFVRNPNVNFYHLIDRDKEYLHFDIQIDKMMTCAGDSLWLPHNAKKSFTTIEKKPFDVFAYKLTLEQTLEEDDGEHYWSGGYGGTLHHNGGAWEKLYTDSLIEPQLMRYLKKYCWFDEKLEEYFSFHLSEQGAQNDNEANLDFDCDADFWKQVLQSFQKQRKAA